jgi:hypothetical protein
VRFRVVGGRFYRSIETVHRYFKHVLGAILKLHKHVIKLPDSDTPLEIRKNGKFYPYFKVSFKGFHFSLFILIKIKKKKEKKSITYSGYH